MRGALDGVWRYYEVTSKAPVEIAAAENDGFVWNIKGHITVGSNNIGDPQNNMFYSTKWFIFGWFGGASFLGNLHVFQ